MASETKLIATQLQVQLWNPTQLVDMPLRKASAARKHEKISSPSRCTMELFDKQGLLLRDIGGNDQKGSYNKCPTEPQSNDDDDRGDCEDGEEEAAATVTARRIVDFDTLFFCNSTMKKRRSLIGRVHGLIDRNSWSQVFCSLTGDQLAMYKGTDEDGQGVKLVAELNVTKYTLEKEFLKHQSGMKRFLRRALHSQSDWNKARGLDQDEVTFSLVPIVHKGWLSPMIKALESYHFAAQSSDWALWEFKILEAQSMALKVGQRNGRFNQGNVVVERRSVMDPIRPSSHGGAYETIKVNCMRRPISIWTPQHKARRE